MIYCDRIYGIINEPHPVFSEIITSPTFQRLQHISMGPWRPDAPFYAVNVSRYHHSIGVFMLLNMYGASVPEQISGLIHDVSHTAFSHLSDRLFGNTESIKASAYQDNMHDAFVKNSDLAQIITRAGFDLDEILDDSKFVLKERDLPDLCADRIDYSLRAMHHMHTYGRLLDCDEYALARAFVPTKNGFVMRDIESARTFAHAFNETDAAVYSSFEGVFYEEMLTRICRDAISRGILSRDDFFRMTDMQIIRKMHMAGIDFSPMYEKPANWIATPNTPNAITMPQKIRRVNPPFIDTDGNIKRLSDADAVFAAEFSRYPKFVEYNIKSR